MNKVAIVTDSASTIPQDLVLKYGIHIVPLLIHLEGRTYIDTVDIKSTGELFQLIDSSRNFPTTSAPTPGEYAELYRRLSSVVTSILTITISSGVSMCFQSACKARDLIRSEKVHNFIDVLVTNDGEEPLLRLLKELPR